jgi:MFS family permease
MLVVACGHFNRIAITVAGAERIIPEQGISPERMGIVYSAFLVFYTLAMVPGGWFIDRFGTRAAFVFLCFASSLLVALTGLTGLVENDVTSLWSGLLVVRAALGIVNAPLHPASAQTVFRDIALPARSLANGLVTFAACVGIAATYPVMGWLIDRFDWPRAFLLCGITTLVVAVVWTACTRAARGGPGVGARGTVDFKALLLVLRRRSVICITLAYAAQGYFQYQFFYWLQYFFETIQHQEPSVGRRNSAIVTLVMGFGMIGGGWMADVVGRSSTSHLRRAVVPVLAMIGSGAVFVFGLLTPDPRVTLAAFTVAAGLCGAYEGAFWTTGVELGGRFGGTTAGLMNAGGNLGGSLSPTVAPFLGGIFAQHYGEDTGWRMALAVAGVVVIAGSALWMGVRPAEAK